MTPETLISAIIANYLHGQHIIFYMLAYIIGSLPFGFIIGRYMYKINIMEHGSNSIGSTNVTRLCGKKAGLATLLLDSSKAAICAYSALLLFGAIEIAFISGLCAMLGHIFSIFLRFKGGKGVASAYGILLVLVPKLAIIALLLWLVVFGLWRVSSISALCSWLGASIGALLLYAPNISAFVVLYALIILLLHINNIKRLLSKQEHHFKK